MTEEKKQPKKRIQLVDVVLERKGSQNILHRQYRVPGTHTIQKLF